MFPLPFPSSRGGFDVFFPFCSLPSEEDLIYFSFRYATLTSGGLGPVQPWHMCRIRKGEQQRLQCDDSGALMGASIYGCPPHAYNKMHKIVESVRASNRQTLLSENPVIARLLSNN